MDATDRTQLPTDTATFAASNTTEVSISALTEAAELHFNAGASSFTITTEPGVPLIISGAGIENASVEQQMFVCGNNGGLGGAFEFTNDASAGIGTLFTVAGSFVSFNGTSTADHATFVVTPNDENQGYVYFFGAASAGSAIFLVPSAGIVNFDESNTAANAQFTVTGGDRGPGYVSLNADSTAADAVINCSEGGVVDFQGVATADHAQIMAEGAVSNTGEAGSISFSDNATGGDATIILNGGTATDAPGAVIDFYEKGTAGKANITLNGGASGGMGAAAYFHYTSDGGKAHFALFDSGALDISEHLAGTVRVGSIEDNGLVFLGANSLEVGGNNQSATFSGVIQDSGAGKGTGGKRIKVGKAQLILSGANTYTGGTTVGAGALVVSNATGSATGTGSVGVNGGTLGGGGSISGAVTIGTGSGSGATLQPSFGTNKKVALTIQGQITLKSDSSYNFHLKSRKAEVVTNGVTIISGAQFILVAPKKKLRAGIKATVISNTSSNPISGTFANLPDGATITSGGNTYQANYEGGDGNDLTLTVQ